FYSSRPHLSLLPFPTRLSSDLLGVFLVGHVVQGFEQGGVVLLLCAGLRRCDGRQKRLSGVGCDGKCLSWDLDGRRLRRRLLGRLDRKSTRLNSSHGSISYAVFC